MSQLPGIPVLLYVRPARPPEVVADLHTKSHMDRLALPSREPRAARLRWEGAKCGLACEHPSGYCQVAVAHAGDFSLHDRAMAIKGPGRPGGNLEVRALFVPIWVKGVGIEIGRERDR